MLYASVVTKQDGYWLQVEEVPVWRVALSHAVDWTCANTGHPLCGGWGWTYRIGIGPWRPVDETMLNLGNVLYVAGQRILRAAWGRPPVQFEIPVNTQTARTLGATWVDELLDD